MMLKYLIVIIFLVPIIVNASEGYTWKDIFKNAYIIGEPSAKFDKKNVLIKKADIKLLGLDNKAKEFLLARYNRGGRKCVKDADRAIKGLNTKFAICAAKFLQDWENSGEGRVTITSAYRSASEQKCVCPSAVPGKCAKTWFSGGEWHTTSKHARGIAIDVVPSKRNFAEFHTAARKFGGVYFNLGMRDRVHLVPNGERCGTGGSVGEIVNKKTPNKENTPNQSYNEDKQRAPADKQNQNYKRPSQNGVAGAPRDESEDSSYSVNKYDIPNLSGHDSSTGAKIICVPKGFNSVLVKWSCGSETTRSRIGSTNNTAMVRTYGKLTGEEGADVSRPTLYKLQCMSGDKLLAEDACRADPKEEALGIENAIINGWANITGRGEASIDAFRYGSSEVVMYLSADKTNLKTSGGIILDWVTSGVKSCKFSGGIVRKVRGSGSLVIKELSNTTTYTLTCDTPNGKKNKTITINMR